MPTTTHSFTTHHNGRVNVLANNILISQAFDPAHTSDPPKFKRFRAIWDTGATNCVITKKVIDECGLKPIGMRQVHSVGLTRMSDVFLVNIILPNKVGIQQVSVTEGGIMGADVLIGMDIIGLGDFAVTNKDGKTTFSFRYPSVERIDFVGQTKRYPSPLAPKLAEMNLVHVEAVKNTKSVVVGKTTKKPPKP